MDSQRASRQLPFLGKSDFALIHLDAITMEAVFDENFPIYQGIPMPQRRLVRPPPIVRPRAAAREEGIGGYHPVGANVIQQIVRIVPALRPAYLDGDIGTTVAGADAAELRWRVFISFF